jgi:hypothetical protein
VEKVSHKKLICHTIPHSKKTTTTMAPNIQHNLHLLSAGPRSIAHLNVKTAPGAAVAKDYQRSVPVADSASYWRWESPKDLFSAEHVVATTVRSATTTTSDVTTQQDATNDSYWTEASRSTPADYWDERSSTSKSCAVEANYWSEAQAPRHFGDDEEARLQQSYWDEVNHPQSAISSSPVDDYWREEQSPERHYWDWTSSQATTARDRYWVM